ncbi:MAG: hypothetical protein ACRD36_11135, partial [Candidatus Acidiferrum sp.]
AQALLTRIQEGKPSSSDVREIERLLATPLPAASIRPRLLKAENDLITSLAQTPRSDPVTRQSDVNEVALRQVNFEFDLLRLADVTATPNRQTESEKAKPSTELLAQQLRDALKGVPSRIATEKSPIKAARLTIVMHQSSQKPPNGERDSDQDPITGIRAEFQRQYLDWLIQRYEAEAKANSAGKSDDDNHKLSAEFFDKAAKSLRNRR